MHVIAFIVILHCKRFRGYTSLISGNEADAVFWTKTRQTPIAALIYSVFCQRNLEIFALLKGVEEELLDRKVIEMVIEVMPKGKTSDDNSLFTCYLQVKVVQSCATN